MGNSKASKIKLPFDDMEAADDNVNQTVCLGTWDTTNDFIVHDDSTSTPSQPRAPSFAAVVRAGGTAG